ncbi:phage tail protein [Sagittula sp. NFXS13]|uniref:phage tail protein n=1 Tax=Sagittula sp. NFXS13 TaxID=2819095 RepID=UPI0032DE7D5A
MPVIFAPPVEPEMQGYADKETAEVNRAQFEGGYAQRSRTGPNSVTRDVPMSFVVTDPQRRELLDFFRARAGVEAFLYQSPFDDAPGLWTCAAWPSSPVGKRGPLVVWRMMVTFKREFDAI